MIPTLSQVCSLPSSLEMDFEDYAAGNCHSIEVWLGKLEHYLEHRSVDSVRHLADRFGLRLPVASFQGGLFAHQDAKSQLAWELFEQRLVHCQALEIAVLVVACDARGEASSDEIRRTQTRLRRAAQLADRFGVKVAVEFQANSAICNNLQTMTALVDETNCRNLGICLDVFHFYVGPSKLSDLSLLTTDNLFHVQLSDISDVPREFAKDAHRIMPGDGDLPLREILDFLDAIRYQQCVSLELMNPQIWQVPALQFGEIAMAALSSLLEQYAPE